MMMALFLPPSRLLSLILASSLLALAAVGCGNKKLPDISMPKVFQPEKPEVKIRNQIAAVLAAPDEEHYFKSISELFERAREVGWSRRQLIEAVIDYATHLSGPDETGRYNRMLTTLDLPRSSIVDAAAPLLDTAQGPAADATHALLSYAAPPDPRSRTDFSSFKSYLESHANPPPTKLVLWMYARDPAAALWMMRDVYAPSIPQPELNELTAAEHVISEILFRQQAGLLQPDQFESAALAQLEHLARSPRWWVRLYCASVLLDQPRLRKPQVLDLLKTDADPLVRQTLGRIQ